MAWGMENGDRLNKVGYRGLTGAGRSDQRTEGSALQGGRRRL